MVPLFFLIFNQEQVISNECQIEMAELRQDLMEDYSISPEILNDCHNEILESCENGLERGGKTIHCLMNLARPVRDQMKHKAHAEMTPKCRRAVSFSFILKLVWFQMSDYKKELLFYFESKKKIHLFAVF